MSSKTFYHIASIVRTNRLLTGLSQTELSKALGYKNGQFISNVERGLCSVPADAMTKMAEVISIDTHTLVNAATEDFKEHLLNTTKRSA